MKKKILICVLPILLFLSATIVKAQPMMPMPGTGGGSGFSRPQGFWFVAPEDFLITGLRVPNVPGSTDNQILQVAKLQDQNAQTGYKFNITTLYFKNGTPNGVIQNVLIPVQAGDTIGIFGTLESSVNSHGNVAAYSPKGSYTSIIGTYTIPIMGIIEGGYHTTAFTSLSNATKYSNSSELGRVEVYYDDTKYPDDAGISKIVSPSLPICDLKSKDVKVELTNYGHATLTAAQIHWSINGVPQIPRNWRGSLANKAVDIVTIGNHSFNDYDVVKVWTELPNGNADPLTFNDASEIELFASLHGNYTIGGANPDYANFTAAVLDLNLKGLCDAVVFNVRPGKYDEQIQINKLFGQAANRPVSFIGDTGTSRPVLRGTTATNTIYLNNVSNVSFKKIKINNKFASKSRVILLTDDVSNTTFDSCYIVNNSTSSNLIEGSSLVGKNIVFTNNTLENGASSIIMAGGTYDPPTADVTFENNKLINPYSTGIKFSKLAEATISHNDISSNSKSTSGYGIYATSTNNTTISYNKIYCTDTANSSWPKNGIYLNELGFGVTNGTVPPTGEGNNIYNNFIQVGNSSYAYQQYGLYFYHPNGLNAFYNNNINLFGTSTQNNGVFVNNNQGVGLFDFYNNIIKIQEGTVYKLVGAATADNNNYYTEGNMPLLNIDGGTYYNIIQLHGHNLEINSLSEDPVYDSYKDLYSCNINFKGAGTYYKNLNNFIDGKTRDSLDPDMGASNIAFDPVGVLGSDTSICSGDTIQLGYKNIVGTFKWNTGDSTSALSVTSPGTYTWEAKTICGQDSASIKIVRAGVTLIPDTFLCPGDSIGLGTSNMPGLYVWNNGDTTSRITATKPDLYVLYSNNECGESFDSVLIADAAVNASFTDSVNKRTVFYKAKSGYQYSYLWDFGDNKNSTIQNPIHFYIQDGNYNVVLKITNICGTEQNSRMITVETPTGIEELSAEQLIVKPNPSNGNFILQLNDMAGEETSIHILDIRGRQVYNTNFEVPSKIYRKQINLNDAHSGVYMLRVQTANKFHEQKIIVVK